MKRPRFSRERNSQVYLRTNRQLRRASKSLATIETALAQGDTIRAAQLYEIVNAEVLENISEGHSIYAARTLARRLLVLRARLATSLHWPR